MTHRFLAGSLRSAALFAALGCTALSAKAQISVNVSTGLDSTNTAYTAGGQTDAHWTVPPQAGGAAVAAKTVFSTDADWYSGWIANDSSSTWIARNNTITDNGAASYTFSTTFNLTGANLATATLSGTWTIDDAGTLNLNGNQLSSLASGNWGSMTSFSAPTADFVQGVNTLSITITSDDDYLEGVRLSGTATARPAATPEPGALALIASLGMTGAGFFVRGRRVGK